jgi:hypothetical protein
MVLRVCVYFLNKNLYINIKFNGLDYYDDNDDVELKVVYVNK